MKLPFNRKSYLALTGDSRSAMLAEISKTPSGAAQLHILARTDSALTEDVTLPRLLAGAGNLKGRISLVLPLSFFELVTTNIPLMPDGAVGKALPYHLAKALNTPLNEFTYDWQITGRFRDRLQVTVYLFPAGVFQKIRREFTRQQVELSFFEPDVFAAFAFLFQEKKISPSETTLCVLLWQDSISLAVYEKGKLSLTRTVKSLQPQGEITLTPQTDPGMPSPARPETADNPRILEADQPQGSEHIDTASILADFCVLTTSAEAARPQTEPPAEEEAEAPAPAPEKPAAAETDRLTWADYLNSIPLEIMRTRDYYASIQKGAAIRNIFIGGADAFWPELSASCSSLLGIPCKSLTAAAEGQECAPLLQVLALGTGARW